MVIFNANAYIYLNICSTGLENLYAEVAYLASVLTCNNQPNNTMNECITIRTVDKRNFPRSDISLKINLTLKYRVGLTRLYV